MFNAISPPKERWCFVFLQILPQPNSVRFFVKYFDQQPKHEAWHLVGITWSTRICVRVVIATLQPNSWRWAIFKPNLFIQLLVPSVSYDVSMFLCGDLQPWVCYVLAFLALATSAYFNIHNRGVHVSKIKDGLLCELSNKFFLGILYVICYVIFCVI